jgi:hypothetical protein
LRRRPACTVDIDTMFAEEIREMFEGKDEE